MEHTSVAQHDEAQMAQQAAVPQYLSYTQRQRKKEADDQAKLVEAIKQGVAAALQPLEEALKELKVVIEDLEEEPPAAGGAGTRRK